jgi:hypothetical protein
MRNALLNLLLLIHVPLCAAAVTWPGLGLLGAGAARPSVLGLPFCFAWNVGWVLLTFMVLLTYHFLRKGDA